MPAVCDGEGDTDGDHCCYVDGVPCPHLEVDGSTGRRYACGLFVELGSWDAVHTDPRYLADVQPTWDRVGIESCGSWVGGCCFMREGTAVTLDG